MFDLFIIRGRAHVSNMCNVLTCGIMLRLMLVHFRRPQWMTPKVGRESNLQAQVSTQFMLVHPGESHHEHCLAVSLDVGTRCARACALTRSPSSSQPGGHDRNTSCATSPGSQPRAAHRRNGRAALGSGGQRRRPQPHPRAQVGYAATTARTSRPWWQAAGELYPTRSGTIA